MICHSSCAIRRRICGLLSSPTCPDSSGIHALGRRRRPSGRLERRAPSSPHREATPYHDAHAPLAGAGNLNELVECVGLRKPAAGLSGYEASWRDDPPWMLCRPAKTRAGFGERRVRLMVWEYGPHGDLWSMATAYGLAGCETADFVDFCELLEDGWCEWGAARLDSDMENVTIKMP